MDCCNSSNVATEAAICPGCKAQGQDVKIRTIKHWLKTPLVPLVPETAFRFCETRDCNLVYFSADGYTRYAKHELRYPVGIKEADPSLAVCYCFGVTPEMIAEEIERTGGSRYSTWIAKEVKDGNCACDVKNPAGRCCLKAVKDAEGAERER